MFWWFSYKPSEQNWAISPKRKHQLSKMTLSTFQKSLFELCFAFSLVVTKKYVLRTSWGLSTWNYTCFLFKCRVTFPLRQFSKATFGTFDFYILRLRCLGISNTYRNSFCFLRKTETSQNDVEYVPEKSSWALLSSALLDSLVVNKKMFWELAEISLLETIRVFRSNEASRFGCAIFRTLRSVLWLFTSCVWDVLWYRIFKKNSSFFLSKTETFRNDVEYVPKMSLWALLGLILWL